MTKKHLYLIASASLAIMGLASCGGEEEVKPLDMEFTTDSINYDAKVEIDLVSVNFPSPNALSKKMSGAGISYNKGLLNPNGKTFSTKSSQAMGLGMYGADLGYACAFNNQQDALNYLQDIGKLADALGIGTAFDAEFNKQLVGSLGKADSMDIMIDKAYAKAERHMRSNERMQLAAFMVIGGWIEGLYVSTQMVYAKKEDPKVKPIYNEIWQYVSAYKNVRNLIEEYKKTNADFKAFDDVFTPLEPAFKAAFDNNANFGPKDIDALKTAIETLRNKYAS